MVGLWVALVFAIIGATIVACVYMFLCAEEGVKMFEDPKCAERIRELERKVADLKEIVNVLTGERTE